MQHPCKWQKGCRGLLQVIVVDVEDRDDSVWHNLTPLDGGLSGWHLLWDRWCPIPSLRCSSATERLSHGFWQMFPLSSSST